MCVKTREARDDRAHRAIIAQTTVDHLVVNPVHP
jgi:hypothetical protein